MLLWEHLGPVAQVDGRQHNLGATPALCRNAGGGKGCVLQRVRLLGYWLSVRCCVLRAKLNGTAAALEFYFWHGQGMSSPAPVCCFLPVLCPNRWISNQGIPVAVGCSEPCIALIRLCAVAIRPVLRAGHVQCGGNPLLL